MTGKAPETGRLYEEWLVTMAMTGDRDAASRLAARYQPRLLRTARRMLGDADLAAGAVQDAWLGIVPGIKRLRHPGRFAAFAFSVLHRRCADTIRSAQRGRAVFDTSAEIEPAAAAAQDEALAIRQAFALLPDDQRLAAHLFFVEGLTLAEIAQVQGIPEGTAKSRLFHARQKLKAALTLSEGDLP